MRPFVIVLLALALLAPLAIANDAKPGGFGFETWIRQSDALTATVYVDGVEVCSETVGPAELVSWEGGDINIQLEVPTTCGPTVTLFGADWRWEEDPDQPWGYRSWWELHAFASTEGLPSARGVFETDWGEPGTLHAEQDFAPGMTVKWDGWFFVVF